MTPLMIDGTSSTNIFGVGSYGGVFRFDGVQWTQQDSPTFADLRDVWAADHDHAYAVGRENVLMFDGTSWRVAPTGPVSNLTSVWGTSLTNVFAAGGNQLLHFDGRGWSGIRVVDDRFWTSAVSGSGPSDVFVVSSASYSETTPRPIAHFDGRGWSTTSSGTNQNFTDVWSSGPGDAFAAGEYGAILHYDGVAWSHMVPEGTLPTFFRVWGTSGTDVYGVAYRGFYHYDGISWKLVDTGLDEVADVWGASSADVFAISYFGNHSEFAHFDGAAWTPKPLIPEDTFTAAWTSDTADDYMVGREGSIVHRFVENDRVETQIIESGTTERLNALWKTSERFVAVGENGVIVSSTGGSWTPMASGVDVPLYGVWGRLDRFVVVGEGGTILRYDGTAWTRMTSGVNVDLRGVWGNSSMSDLYAVGHEGTILHYDGKSWTAMQSGTNAALTSVWGMSGTFVHAVGTHGTALRYDGSAWTRAYSGTTTDLTGVWGASANCYFFGGADGIHSFVDGEAIYTPAFGIVDGHASSERNSVAVSGQGVVFHFSRGNS
ncbi:MAG TPA: hypothetical protein VF247_03260 [Candidatus Krumholzibacteria bacterium]